MADQDTPLPHVPEAKILVRKRTRLSLVWVIPIVAAVIGAWVTVASILKEGPTITIILQSAEGLEAGKTKIHYKGVDVGAITAIRLSDDHLRVIATASMAPKSENVLVEDTKFWVVSPRISGASVSGLGTLVSGSYIAVEIGKSQVKRRQFVALATPPIVTGDIPGRFFVLKTADLGSVDSGTPIYFRRLRVGQVASYELDKDGRAFTLKVFIDAPYDQYVTPETRFWEASGIDMSLSASGVSLKTQSVLSVLVGGLAFETPATAPVLPPADENTVFTLYNDRANAYRPPPQNPQTYVLVFNHSVRGLTIGAPVEARGIPLGSVEDIRAQFDRKAFNFSIFVTISVDAQRLGVKVIGEQGRQDAATHRKVIDALVAHGLRAQLQTGSLLTGALYVSLDFFPDAPPASVDWSQTPARLVTVPNNMEGIESSVASIIKKLDQVPYKEIGGDLRKTLAGVQHSLTEVDQTLVGARRTLGNADKLIEPGTGLDQELASTLQELQRAARGLRVITEYLERHPEALIHGKSEEKQ